MNDRVAAINCTNCGGALERHGGHRVRTLTCGYCGSQMDAHADYQILQKFENLKRPSAPLKIGMSGTIKGIEQTVIGMIEYAMREEGITYSWVAYQLFSPTHGYGWLIYNNGHFVFGYQVRDLPSHHNPAHLLPKTEIKAMGRSFRMYESYQAHIRYVEGELTWVAKVGDTVTETEAIDPPFVFSFERSETEVEYTLGEYLDRDEILDAFGEDIDLGYEPIDIHPAQPFKPSRVGLGAHRAGLIFAPVAVLALLATFALGGGAPIQQATIDDPVTGGTVPFTATDAGYLYQVSLDANVANSWAYYEVGLTREGEDVEIGALGESIEYYYGRDSDGSWTEGSTTATATFHVPEAGNYELEVQLVEAANMSGAHRVLVEVRENVYVIRYFAVLAIVTLIAAAFMPIRRMMFEAKRWKAVTGDDDDDD